MSCRKNPVLYFSLLLLILTGFAQADDTYVFEKVDEVVFPVAETYLISYDIADMDNDGTDDMILLYDSVYYVYSFARGEIIYKDSGLTYNGVEACQFDEDDQLELLLVKSQGGGGYYIPSTYDSAYVRDLEYPDEEPTFLVYNIWHIAKLKAESYIHLEPEGPNGFATLLFGCYGGFYLNFGAGVSHAAKCGQLAAYSIDTGDRSWTFMSEGGIPDLSVPLFSNEFMLLYDLDGNSAKETLTWGYFYEYDKFLDTEWIKSYFMFRLFLSDYSYDFYDISSRMPRVTAGDIDLQNPGQEFLLFKRGESIDPGVFEPADSTAIYCLYLDGQEVNVLWGKDIAETANDYDGWLFSLPSIAGTFCLANSSQGYDVFDGSDGSRIGELVGLATRKKTVEGNFLSTSGDRMTVVQIDGATISLYQLDVVLDTGEDGPNLPFRFSLGQNHPNPFNAGTKISFSLGRASEVSLTIFDILGRPVRTLASGRYQAGEHTVEWDGTDSEGRPAASGVYLYELTTDAGSKARKMALIK